MKYIIKNIKIGAIILLIGGNVNARNIFDPLSVDSTTLESIEFDEDANVPELNNNLDNGTNEQTSNSTEETEIDANETQKNKATVKVTEIISEETEETKIDATEPQKSETTIEVTGTLTEETQITKDETDTSEIYEEPPAKIIVRENPIFNQTEIVPKNDQSDIKPSLSNWIISVVEHGNNWYETDWFEYYFKSDTSVLGMEGVWVYHVFLEWIYIDSKDFDSIWIWSDKLGGWVWTSSEIFPFMFKNNTSSWLTYFKEQNLFYDYLNKNYFKFE